ncbi:MAG: hypothetical protein A2087_05570 [Spirochaetes bacterium GWD1_61_31]|nr:MAG: hypothetical protein A2Y37_03620 [Spirochaetes bacterium GWB1_60_80]OHD35105.1 MAG: hypothetical protein A2004_05315 [Spirochaetes bacterium GWC1_61_12]OHD43623.1 MAG: hypothetical protein A2087_05570 [Spirochaetes bacterium GWD1_61_31]OHD44115.1 MAG: hypothetical protein A2Y35_01995 [Spirochaetes bacterium GWE1_60_18]OHD61844.1 MAG: hypothetical protein A2Y32_13880 [Spirochaetes bacterium GWF1_60_12]HAW85091.1 hypothetical protein [Spirochaetaceae bacterium]
MRKYGILQLYIAREFLLSFIISFLFFFVIFFINQLLLMAEEILSKNAPLIDVAMLIIFAMPAIIAMSFPFASLVGSIMAISRFVVDNEFLVMRASGVARKVVFVPFLLLAIVFSVISFISNDYFLPLGTMNYARTYRRLITTAPALELRPYSVKNYQNTIIITGAIDKLVIHDLVIIDETKDGKSRVITADTARLLDHAEEQSVISLILENVFTQESNPATPNKYEYSSASRMEYNILLSNFTDVSSSLGPHEMRSVDVLSIIDEKQAAFDIRLEAHQRDISNRQGTLADSYLGFAQDGVMQINNLQQLVTTDFSEFVRLAARRIEDRSLYLYKLEYYKKFSIPFGALCFVFLAFPLSVSIKKNNRGMSFGLGLLVALLYWALLLGGQNFGLRTGFSPFLSMWLPNIMVLGGGLVMTFFKRER